MIVRRILLSSLVVGLVFILSSPALNVQNAHGAALVKPGDLLITDEAPNCPIGGPIFRISGGEASVLAQGGPLGKPRGSALDNQGNLIVADSLANGSGLRKVDLGTGAVTTIASSPLVQPRDVAVDGEGNYIVVDWPESIAGDPAVYRVSTNGQVSLVAQGSPLVAPHGIDIDARGNYIIADFSAGVIRVTPGGRAVLIHATEPGSAMSSATDVRVDASGDYIIADITGALLRGAPDGTLTLIYRGAPFSLFDPQTRTGGPRGLAIDSDGTYVVLDQRSRTVFKVTPQGTVTALFGGAPLCGPADLLVYRPSAVLVSPASGAQLTSLGAALSWTNPAGTTQYHLQVVPANNDGPGINIIRNAETSFQVQAPTMGVGPYVMLPGMSYSWRIRASDSMVGLDEHSANWGPWSPARTFKTPAPSSATIAPLRPAQGAAVAAAGTTLQWSNAASDVFYYELQVSSDPQFGEAGAFAPVWWNLVHGGVTTPFNGWITPQMQSGATYFWRVRPRVQGDGTPVAWSQTWSFTTQ